MTKQCIGCGNHQPHSEFYDSSRHEDGKNPYCKHCCKVNRALESVRRRDKKSRISFRQEYRAKELGIHYETRITLAMVFKSSRGICGICGEWVQPKHASMDHIIPISKGGTHTKRNLQITHVTCNKRKGNRV